MRHSVAASVRAALFAGTIVLASTSAAQAPSLFNVDASHSSVGFTVRFMGLSTVRGSFSAVQGAILYSASDVTRSSVSAVVGTGSISTGSAFRDRHLRSPDFLDVEKYPLMTFQSRRIERHGDGFIAHGPLTIHGVTKEVAIPFVQMHPPTKDAWENLRVGFQGKLTVSRKEFGVLGTAFWNSEYDPGRFAVADNVELELQISATQSNFERRHTPMSDTVLALAQARGIDAALAHIRELNGARTDSLIVDQMALATTGYTLLQRNRVEEAIRVFTLWTETTPTSADAFDSLGEAYVKAGKHDLAVRSYERALALNPSLPSSMEMLRWLRARRG